MSAKKLIIAILIIYAIIMLALFIFQRRLIYFPELSPAATDSQQFSGMQKVWLKTQDGLTIHAWYKPAKADKPTLVFFHGNASHIQPFAPAMQPYFKVGYGIFLLVYRGYSGNPGNPSENGLYNDANAAINYLEKKGTPTSQMVLVGESLGAGVAVDIAAKHKVAALILLAPFSSLTRLSQWHYVFIPAKLILKDRFDSLSKIKQVNAPLLIIHGTEDKIVPIKFGKELFAAANKPKEFEAVAGAHHNDLYDYGVQKKIIDFLQSKKEN